MVNIITTIKEFDQLILTRNDLVQLLKVTKINAKQIYKVSQISNKSVHKYSALLQVNNYNQINEKNNISNQTLTNQLKKKYFTDFRHGRARLEWTG